MQARVGMIGPMCAGTRGHDRGYGLCVHTLVGTGLCLHVHTRACGHALAYVYVHMGPIKPRKNIIRIITLTVKTMIHTQIRICLLTS